MEMWGEVFRQKVQSTQGTLRRELRSVFEEQPALLQ